MGRFPNRRRTGGWPSEEDCGVCRYLSLIHISIVFAFDARLARGATRARLAWHTLKRAAILFLLGVVVNSFPFFKLEHMRIYGVLQRIAICYLVVGLLYIWDQRVWTKVAALVVALVGYWVLLRWVPVPGAGLPDSRHASLYAANVRCA